MRHGRTVAILIALGLFLDGATARAVTAPPTSYASAVNGQIVTLTWIAPSGTVVGYRLEAGTGPGLANIIVFDMGATTTLVVAAPPGVYYTRIRAIAPDGVSGPSNEIVVAVGTAPPPPPPPPVGRVEVGSDTTTVRADYFGDTLIIGEVVNRSASMTAFVKVNATLYNTTGNVIGTDFTYVHGLSRRLSTSGIITDTTLAPSESGCFWMSTDVPRAALGRLSLNVDYDVRSSSGLVNQVVLTGVPTRRDSLGDLRLLGEMRNSGTGITYFNKTVFYIQRADRLADDCDFTYVNGSRVLLRSGITTSTGLLGGQVGTYDAFTSASSTSPFVRGWTQWDEGVATPADPYDQVLSQDVREALLDRDRVRAQQAQDALEANRQARDRQLRIP